MRITFILPGYPPVPVGGPRIVYGYANYLAKGGYNVSIGQPPTAGASGPAQTK